MDFEATMPNEALDLLEEAANKATPGIWNCWGGTHVHAPHLAPKCTTIAQTLLPDKIEGGQFQQAKADAEYIALVNPQVVLHLIDEIRAYRAHFAAHRQ